MRYKAFFVRVSACERGAAAVEFAIIAFVMILVCLGTIEFGRGLYLRNDISSVADYAARKILTDTAISNAELESVVRDNFTGPEPDQLAITLGAEEVDGLKFRTVAISYPLKLLIPGLTSDAITLNLARRIPVI